MPGDETIIPSHLRHNEKWALSKSARHSANMTGLRVAIIAIILVILLGAVGLFLQHHKSPGTKPPTTTTTTKHTTSSPAMRSPSSFTLASPRVWSHVAN